MRPTDESPQCAETVASPVRALIDADAIRHNVRILRGCCRDGVALCPAVKADGYGHGLAHVLPPLRTEGIQLVAVACVAEGVEVRRLGWTGRVLVFGPSLESPADGPDANFASVCLTHELEPTATGLAQVDALVEAARARRAAAAAAVVHVKVDSGMGRMGLGGDLARELAARIDAAGELSLGSVYTHFATADEADRSFVHRQLEDFRRVVASIERAGVRIPLLHAANSAAILQEPTAHFDMVRPGLGIYGYLGGPDAVSPAPLRPAMKVVSHVGLVKELPAGRSVGYGRTWTAERPTRLGIVPIGYADGYLRWFSNRAMMRVGDRFVPVVGRVSMDLTTIDLTDLPDAGPGDEVVVIDNNAASPNSVESLAQLVGTIPYEITCTLSRRVARVPADPEGNAQQSD